MVTSPTITVKVAAPTTGIVTGTVTDVDTGTPIVGALVKIALGSTMSGSNGTYTLTSVPEGSQAIIVTMLGYEKYTGHLIVIAGTTITHDVAMIPLPKPSLVGVVTGLFGKPVENAKVTLNAQETLTLADGSFKFENLPLGTYILEISHWLYEIYSEEMALTERIIYTRNISLKVKFGIKVSVAAGAVLSCLGVGMVLTRRP